MGPPSHLPGLITPALGHVISDVKKADKAADHVARGKPDKVDHVAKVDKPDKPEKIEKPEKPAKPEKSGR